MIGTAEIVDAVEQDTAHTLRTAPPDRTSLVRRMNSSMMMPWLSTAEHQRRWSIPHAFAAIK